MGQRAHSLAPRLLPLRRAANPSQLDRRRSVGVGSGRGRERGRGMGLVHFGCWRRPMYRLMAAGCRSPRGGNNFERFRDPDGIGSLPHQNEVCSVPVEAHLLMPLTTHVDGNPELLIYKTKEAVDEQKVGTMVGNFDLDVGARLPPQEKNIGYNIPMAVSARGYLDQSSQDQNKLTSMNYASVSGASALFRQRSLMLKTSSTFRHVNTSAGEFGDSPPGSTEHFKVTVTQPSTFIQQLDHYKAMNNSRLAAMEYEYETEVRPLFMPSGLILPYELKDSSTAFLHYQAHLELDRRPTYATSFDIMVKKNSMTAQVWDYFAEYIISSRTFIVEDMNSTCGNIESQSFDFGIVGPSNGELYYKGECDASFHAGKVVDGKADLSCVLWDKNQVLWSEVVKGVECPDSTTAEVLAAILLIMRCIELKQKLPKLKNLALYSDSKCATGVVNGDYSITFKTKNREEYMLLRSLSQHLRD